MEATSDLPVFQKTPASFMTHLRSDSCPVNCYGTYCPNKYCNQCDEGYYSWNGSCYACGTGCKACRTENQCDACQSGYFFQNGKCTACLSGCATCQNTQVCQKCASGYYMGNTQKTECKECPKGCAECTDPKNCTSCTLFYNLQNAGCVEKPYYQQILIYLAMIGGYLCCCGGIGACAYCASQDNKKGKYSEMY